MDTDHTPLTDPLSPPLSHDACWRIFAGRDARYDGQLYIGVRTTGIYCRPVCPARTPKPENVAFYPSAAAAREAGFRPCLRCRPELAPAVFARQGGSATVDRALRLIDAGTLDDDGSIEHLATRLDVTSRHLRRLFQQQVGASPVSVAQTRRLHLAQQLLRETPLSVTDVAFGAGYGSLRRFNETFQATFAESPTARRRRAAPTTPSGSLTLTLPYQPPFDWESWLTYFAMRLIPGVETITNNRYIRTIQLDGHAGMVSVTPGRGNTLAATIDFPQVTALPRIIAALRRLFDLGANPAVINAHLGADPFLAPLVAARPGLRVPGAWDNFELAVRTILGQQITVAGATRQSGVIVAAFGTPFVNDAANDLGLSHLFPTPSQLAVAPVADLGLMPGARARSLSSLGAAVDADPALLQPGRDLESTVTHLRALPGIGEWTAQYISLRALREPDGFPAADVGLMQAIAPEFGQRPRPAELLRRAEAWRPWRAYAALHLWTSLPLLDRSRESLDVTPKLTVPAA